MKNQESTVLAKCRFCDTPLVDTFVDLGMSPLRKDHVKPGELKQMAPFYPLRAYVCSECFLVQIEEMVSPSEIINHSASSETGLKPIGRYADQVLERFEITEKSLVAEIASNDGHLLHYFMERKIPVLSIEPASNVAKFAIEKGIRTEVKSFGNKTAKELVRSYGKADLLIGNNALTLVPDINDFVSGMKAFLKPEGIIIMEFPHLMRLVGGNQFDTIDQEHLSYLSITTVDKIFKHHGLTLFDVEELATHGGSLRIYGKHIEDESKEISDKVFRIHSMEKNRRMYSLGYYTDFKESVKETKEKVLQFLMNAKQDNKTIVGYGASGKSNTFLNYCGVSTDLIDYTVDRNPLKQGNYLPGSLIPIYHPEKIKETKPDYVFILPWNLKDEIMDQMSFIAEWGGQFVVAIPELAVYEESKEWAMSRDINTYSNSVELLNPTAPLSAAV